MPAVAVGVEKDNAQYVGISCHLHVWNPYYGCLYHQDEFGLRLLAN